MDIAFCLDNNYLMPCGVAICSVCENNKTDDITFHVVSNELNDSGKDKLIKITNKYNKSIVFYYIDNDLLKQFPFGGKNQPTQITVASYIRIFLAEILPSSIEKILYLDCDIIVTDKICDLWDIDIHGHPMAAVLDYCTDDIRHYNSLKLDTKYGYYNAGVAIVNLQYWRDNEVIHKIMDYFNIYRDKLQYQDQDLLNGVFQGKIITLDAKYNVQISYWGKAEYSFSSWKRFDELKFARECPTIIHYISTCKPWHSDCFYTAQQYFLDYLQLTEWSNVKFESQFNFKSRILRKIRHFLENHNIVNKRNESYEQFEDFFLKESFRK